MAPDPFFHSVRWLLVLTPAAPRDYVFDARERDQYDGTVDYWTGKIRKHYKALHSQ